MKTQQHLSRKVLLYVYANGAIVFRDWDNPDVPKGALPVFSVDTQEEAEILQVSLCRISRADNKTYHIPWPEYPDVLAATEAVTKLLHDFYRLKQAGAKGALLARPIQAYKDTLGLGLRIFG